MSGTRASCFLLAALSAILLPTVPTYASGGFTSPSITSAVAASMSQIDVYWRDNSSKETGFEVHCSTAGPNGPFISLATVGANVTVRSNTGLNASTQYCYKVRAFTAAPTGTKYSAFSDVACATTAAAPPPPGLHVTVTTTGTDFPEGYSVGVARTWCSSYSCVQIPEASAAVSPNGTVTFSGLWDEYLVQLHMPAVNCNITSQNPQHVIMPSSSQEGIAIEFNVTCAPVTQLAFVSVDDGNAEIYVINHDGTGRTRVTLNPAADVEPAWSRDGAKIAFTSGRDGDAEVYVMNADGSSPVGLTDSRSVDAQPAWSPDGAKIAFVSDRDGNREIYVMNVDGTGAVNLTSQW